MNKDEVLGQLIREDLTRITLSRPKTDPSLEKEQQLKKAVIRPVLIRGEKKYQAESFTQKQAFHRNLSLEELSIYLDEMLEQRFMEVNADYPDRQVLVKFSKKGKIYFQTSNKAENPSQAAESILETTGAQENSGETTSQNREKHYLIQQGGIMQPLVDLGVLSQDGKVIHSKYDKFKQINRFVELVDDGISQEVQSLRIVDFGCGKSYLTFVLYDYLTRVRGIEVEMTGLDLKAEVIRKCNETAVKYGYDHLHFQVGDIADYDPKEPVDLVISLHACDTATDFALYHAIRWGSERIYSVPCCQHELNLQMKRASSGSLSEYGLLKERFAAILTDAIRADLLRASGYSVDVVEFVDMAHSPKNVLLRAQKIRSRNTGKAAAGKALQRVKEAMETYQVSPTLYRLLDEPEKENPSHE